MFQKILNSFTQFIEMLMYDYHRWTILNATLKSALSYSLCGLCGVMVEHSLAIQNVAGSNFGRSASK